MGNKAYTLARKKPNKLKDSKKKPEKPKEYKKEMSPFLENY